jgi:uncharacterized protein with NAD-binding domain and iron-sulfur cluster
MTSSADTKAGGDAVRGRRIAILGAGPAGLAAAWALSEEAVRDRHEVHIYQMGWRAGGKSATGLNFGAGERIEQNGSHYLFGCYHHSFALVRRAYEELGPRAGFGRFRDEFAPRNIVVAAQAPGYGPSGVRTPGWQDWFQFLPTNLSAPGVGGKLAQPFDYLLILVQVTLRLLLAAVDFGDSPSRTSRWLQALFPLSPFRQDGWWCRVWGRTLRVLLWPAAALVNHPLAWLARAGWRLAVLLYNVILSEYTRYWLGLAAAFWAQVAAARLRDLGRRFWAALGRWADANIPSPSWASQIQSATILFELATTAMVGFAADELWRPAAMERIDGEDLRAWFTRHGAVPEGVGSSFLKCWYDAVIAYENGDPERPRISAAVSLYALFRALFTYKGNFAFQMRHEVGDGFIAPIVEALQRRGVQFHFFHRVRDVVPGVDERGQPVIARVIVEPQLPPGVHQTKILVPNCAGRPVWPNRPQLSDGAAIPDPCALESFYGPDSGRRCSLERGDDFDDVVFALPLFVARHDAPSLLRRNAAWGRMDERIASTESVSLRIWFEWNLQRLGWNHPEPILSGFRSPLSTWEDNCQNLGNEGFPAGKEPKAIATVFGPLPAPGRAPGPGADGARYVQAQQARADAIGKEFLTRGAAQLWTELYNPDGTVRFEAFYDLRRVNDPPGSGGESRMEWQLLRANVGPAERYTMAFPGTLADRLRSDESGYGNMVLAGEWTRNGVEIGSVEGAVCSGLEAARALCGRPRVIIGERDIETGLLSPVIRPRRRRQPAAARSAA